MNYELEVYFEELHLFVSEMREQDFNKDHKALIKALKKIEREVEKETQRLGKKGLF